MEYKGWLTSPNILKRSIAVWGHFILGYIIVLVSILAIMIPITILASLFT